MTPRACKLSLFAVAAVVTLSVFANAAPIPMQDGQLGQLVLTAENVSQSEELDLFVPDEDDDVEPVHKCGLDEADYEDDVKDDNCEGIDVDDEDDDDSDEDDEESDSEQSEEEEEDESTEEDLLASGEADDEYYIGQTYTGLVFDDETGNGFALSTDPDQDLLELAMFLKRKKTTSFEELWDDILEDTPTDDTFEDENEEVEEEGEDDAEDVDVDEDKEIFDSDT